MGNSMNCVMLDLETMGRTSDAAIIQIGAIYFDKETGELGRSFKQNVDIEDSIRNGGKCDGAIEFWLGQPDAARLSLIAEPRLTLRASLESLNQFLQGAKEVWSHAAFDFVIVQNSMARLGIRPLFGYKSTRDIRTLVSLAGSMTISKQPRSGTHHDALDDCKFQVEYCVKCLNKIKRRQV